MENSEPVKAYRVQATGFDAGIYGAASASKAKYKSFKSANDTGYAVKFADITVRRSPEYDAWVSADSRNDGWLEEYVIRATTVELADGDGEGVENVK